MANGKKITTFHPHKSVVSFIMYSYDRIMGNKKAPVGTRVFAHFGHVTWRRY